MCVFAVTSLLISFIYQTSHASLSNSPPFFLFSFHSLRAYSRTSDLDPDTPHYVQRQEEGQGRSEEGQSDLSPTSRQPYIHTPSDPP